MTIGTQVVTDNYWRHFTPVAPKLEFELEHLAPFYIDLRRYLIQGANPYDESVLAANKGFQGGYRCTFYITLPPRFGNAVPDDWGLGIWYYPVGMKSGDTDSFSYKLSASTGQESAPECIYLTLK